jgi:hypothetical protein
LVESLRHELAQSGEKVRVLESERDEYRQVVRALMLELCPESAWEDFNPADYNVTAAEILADLESLSSDQGKAT